jgi:hypothetical protein
MLVPQSFKWIDFRKPKTSSTATHSNTTHIVLFSFLFLSHTSLHYQSSVVGRDGNVAFGSLALVLTLVKRGHAALGLGVAATVEIAADLVPQTEVVERLIDVSRFLVIDAHVEVETVSGRMQTTHGSQNYLLRLQVRLRYTHPNTIRRFRGCSPSVSCIALNVPTAINIILLLSNPQP